MREELKQVLLKQGYGVASAPWRERAAPERGAVGEHVGVKLCQPVAAGIWVVGRIHDA